MPCENITDCYDCVGNCQRCPIECNLFLFTMKIKKKLINPLCYLVLNI